MPGGEYINHIVGVRLRVTGSANLKLKLLSLDEANTQQLKDLVVSTYTHKFETQLANFNEQRASLEIYTEGLDDYFLIRTIIIYNKPVGSSYPQ